MTLSPQWKILNGAVQKAAPFLIVCALLSGCGSPYTGVFIGPDEQGLSPKTTQTVLTLQSTLSTNPDDGKTAFALAHQYLQAVRETADTAYYDRIEQLLRFIEKHEPDNPEISYLRAGMLMGRHDFAGALPLGQKLVADYPDVVRYYGLLTDAQIEMGMYPEAIATLQKMSDVRPDNSVLTRIAYVREIHGDFTGAVEMMQQAVGSPSGTPEQDAWSLSELARLLLPTDLTLAKVRYTQALTIYPGYAPAIAGLAKIAAYEKDLPAAEKLALLAFERLSLPEYSALLGDIYSLQGKKDKSDIYYILTEAGYDAIGKSGTNVDLERAKFLAEHDRSLPLALELAKSVYASRRTIYTADLLSLASLDNNRPQEAWKYAQEALTTGTTDPLILSHAALAAEAVGESGKARQYLKQAAKRPHFSLITKFTLPELF